jgi:hypothetical protein
MTQAESSGTAVESKGLKGGALGLVSSVVVGMASTAPAYSLAASLGLIGRTLTRRADLLLEPVAATPTFGLPGSGEEAPVVAADLSNLPPGGNPPVERNDFGVIGRAQRD